MEHNSEAVLTGKLLHESSFSRNKNKEITVDDIITLDMLDDEYVKEIKLSSKMTTADKMQLYYYLYYLKQMGIERKGKLHYVKEKKTEEIYLTEEIQEEIESALEDINEIINKNNIPPVINKPYCKKCSYYELCYIEGE